MDRESGRLLQDAGHPNVFPGFGPHGTTYICLDMLKPSAVRWQGWSSAYTLASVLQQLGGFLLEDDKIDQGHGGSVARMDGRYTQKRHLPMLSDWIDQHLPSPPRPSSATTTLPPPPMSTNATETIPDELDIRIQGLSLLDDNLCQSILENLDHVGLHRCMSAGEGAGGKDEEGARLARIARDVHQRSQLLCFYTKLNYKECVLGLGLKVSFAQKGHLRVLRQALARPDLLSLVAFRDLGVRVDSSNFAIDAFLPVYLNPEHGPRALREIIPCMQHLVPATRDRDETTGSRLLHLMSSIINSIVVEIAGGKEKGEEWQVTRAMSDAALQTYCHLHHTLLAVVTAGQATSQAQREMGKLAEEVLASARSSVRKFMSSPASGRHKERFPDLGLLLVSYILTPADEAPWSTFGPALLRELLARQVYWVARESGARFLDVAADDRGDEKGRGGREGGDGYRLRQHFDHSKVGLRLVMIQAFFANALARPSKASTLRNELLRIKTSYDSRSGLPPPSTFQAFNNAVRTCLAASSWSACLKSLRLGFRVGIDQRAAFAQALRQGVLDSHISGYHRGPRPIPPPSNASLTRDEVRGESGRAFFRWSENPIGETNNTWN